MEFRDSVGIQSLKEIIRFASGAHEDRGVRDYNDFIRVVVVALKRALDEMLQDVTERHKVPAENRPFIHYTSVSALVSMLKNSEGEGNDFLRLYDSTHVNDPEEGRYLWRFSESTLKDKWADDNRQKHAYIASFVPAIDQGDRIFRDYLDFWRIYGDDGQGCSLEILFPPNMLSRVLYGEDKAVETIRILGGIIEERLPIIEEAISPLMEVGDEQTVQKAKETIRSAIAGQMEAISYLYKSKTYENERECRFVMTGTAIQEQNEREVEFQCDREVEGATEVRHYFEHELFGTRKRFVTGTKFTLGPTVKDPYSLKLYIEHLLKKANLLGPTVECSTILYRSR